LPVAGTLVLDARVRHAELGARDARADRVRPALPAKGRVVGAALLDGVPDVLGDLEVAPACVLGGAGQGRLPFVRAGGRPRHRKHRLVDAARGRLHARRGAALGAGLGYFVPTVWCIGLGILIVLARGVSDAQALPAAVAAAGGVAFAALLAITIDESEKAFADIYSTAVSLQNFLPRMSQRLLITVVSALATGLALALNLGNYQNFLYLLGSFFVPLFGVLVADWLTERAHYTPEHVFNDTEWRPGALVAWL